MVASDYPTKLGVQMIQLNKLCKLTAYNVSFKINLTSSCDILKFFRDNCSRLHNPGKRRYPQIGRTAQSFHPESGQGLSGICFLEVAVLYSWITVLALSTSGSILSTCADKCQLLNCDLFFTNPPTSIDIFSG